MERYTYKQILLSLRCEYLNLQSKLQQLKECVDSDIYFSVIKGDNPEIVIKKEYRRFLKKYILTFLMVHDNHFRYYPLNLTDVKVSDQIKFAKVVKSILSDDFINCNINKVIYSIDGSYILPSSLELILVTPKFEVTYLGYKDAFSINSLKDFSLTLEDFEDILNLEFLAHDFPSYYRNIIDNNSLDMDITFDSLYVPSNKALLSVSSEKSLVLKKGR